MHLAPLIRDLAVVLGVAGLVTLIFKKIRQPVVLGYIIAGIIVGPNTPPFPLVTDIPNIRIWADLGVIFLMFSLGLEFSFRKLAKVGLTAGFTAPFEMAAMWCLGFFVGQALGWPRMDGIFLGAMLSISSTTIIFKALDELKLKTRRFAENIFAVLIVEDLIAILLLVALSTFVMQKAVSGITVLAAAGKLVLVVAGWFITGYFLVPRFIRYVGRIGGNEMLTIVSIGLCLALVVFAAHFQYSVALGAFIMGSILSESTESHRIEDIMNPLRDLFAAIFFVSVGMLIDLNLVRDHVADVALISAVLIIGKVTATTIGSLIAGQTLRTSVQVGFGLAQIGEFSFIIAGLGLTLGVISEYLYSLGVAVSLITAFTTPYLIRASHKFAVGLEGRLPFRVKDGLNRYAALVQAKRADVTQRNDFRQSTFRWILNGLIVSVVFVLVAELFLPFLRTHISRALWVRVIGWASAALASAPFIWAMYSTFRHFEMRGVLLLSRFLCVVWVAALSAEFFPAKYIVLVTLSGAAVLFLIFYRRLETSYQWFEKHFLSTFEASEKSRRPTDMLRHLAPWDAHLVRIKVHPNSELAAKRLSETELRSKHGLNIVAIQRGLKTIVAPKPSEMVFPKDELLVLGTDEQIESCRPLIEKPPGLEDRFQSILGYEMRQVWVTDGSPLLGRTIRDSGIRETFNSMVVGIERNDRRMINPESDLKLMPGDLLWIVGEKSQLDRLSGSLQKA